MAVVLATVRSEVYGSLNAATAFGSNDDPERWTQEEIDAAILNADGDIIRAICDNPMHGARRAFLTSSNVLHGGQIPAHLGPIDSVIFTVTGGLYAGTRDAEFNRIAIEEDNRNPSGLTSIPPRYYVEGDILYHNGAGLIAGGASAVTVAVYYCIYARTSACQAPDEFFDVEKVGAMSKLVNKEGVYADAQSVWGGMYAAMLADIRASGMSVAANRPA